MKRSKPLKKSTHQKRISEAMKLYWRKRKRAEREKARERSAALADNMRKTKEIIDAGVKTGAFKRKAIRSAA